MKNLAHIALAIAEAMSAPRLRDQRRPPAPPDRLPSPRRGLLRSARVLAAAALLALFGGLALPATAQADVLVSNLEQMSRGVGSIIGDRHLAAQSFSVPNGGGNYTLTSIEIVVAEDILIPDIDLLTVSVWSADPSGYPVSSLHTLTNPASIEADVAAMFTVPADVTATLEAGNTYVVVADYRGNVFSNWDATTSDNEDETPSTTGWTLADTSLRRLGTDTSWGSRNYALFLRVNGTAVGGGTPSTTTFVSNTGETPGSRASSIQAQSFTTGSNASGYTLSEVAVQFYTGGLDLPMTFVKVKQDASGEPGDLVANLENPADFHGSSIVSFAAPASTTLAAGTVYWVVVNEGIISRQRISVRLTRSRDETPTTADPNWLIADGRSWKNNDGSSWASSTEALMLAIKGTAMPPAAPTGFTAAVGNAQVALAWAAPAADSGVTGHEFRYKTSGDYPDDWTPIPNSAPDEANEAAFTVTMLTNEVAHTFELRAVSAGGNSEAVEAMPVTPTPGICDRTQKVHEAIVEHLSEVDNCAAVTVADLAGLTTDLDMSDADIAALKAGDFAGLTGVPTLNLARNSFTTLPAGVFSGLTALEILVLAAGQLTELPAEVFSGLTNLTGLNLSRNALSSLPAGVFSGLTALEGLSLNNNVLESLPGTVFSDLTALTSLTLNNNVLESLPAGVFSGLTALEDLYLDDNALNALPAGLFSGLTALLDLTLGGNSTDPLQLTVTVEKVGTGQVRAKVLEGAPFAVAIPVTLENGALAGGATALSVAAGSVEGTAVTVTRTAGTTAAVTVDVDLTPSPTLPSDHSGYEFVKATTDLPATILSEVPPSIVTNGVSVTSTPVAATDTYGAGETIEISVTFNEAVNATTATDFVLSVGGAKRAPLLGGSGTATLVFGYTVQAGDSDTDGIWIGDQDRTLVGNRRGNPQNGTITSVAGVAADLTHGGLGMLSGHKVNGSANTAPAIATTSPVAVAENGTAVATLAATDADDDPITWTKTGGADTARFALTSAGVLTFVAAPDYEDPADVASADPANAAANNEYVVFVTASDGTDGTELELVVQVTNVDEGRSGTVSIDDTAPMIGDELTASTADVADPDGLPDPFAPTWRWYRTPAGGAEAVISGATSATYTVVEADLDAALTAKASWTDAGGFTNTLASAATAAVALPNAAPSFTSSETFNPAENQTTVGTVAASDDDMDDDITGYALSGGADQALFAIDGTTGALTFQTAPDYEDPQDEGTDNAYLVEVQATSGTGDRVQMAPQTIAVTVTNVDEGRSGTVSIDDTAPMVRDELTASTADVADPDGLPDPFAPTWRWYRTPAGDAEAVISGATSATYTVVEADLGAALTAKASWTDLGGFTNTLASAATAAGTPGVPAAPSNLLAAPGDMTVALSWGEPAATIARHDYRFKTDGSYPDDWTAIADSAPGGANATGITVSSLTNGLAYTFQVRAVGTVGLEGDPAESATVTPAGGICARTPQVQTAILAAISGVDDCAVVTATHLSRISDLNLNSAGIGSLQSNDFAGLSSMTRLDLKSNDLAALPPGVFSGLSSLQTLDFRANDLAALRADVFSGLSKLERLELNNNDFTALPEDVFSGLSSLERLQLHANSLSELRAGVFSGLSNLERLFLDRNGFTALPEDVFSGLSSLVRLYLNDNSLNELREDVFSGLSSLERLQLGGNGFTALPEGVFSGLSSLTQLWLNTNSLNELRAGVFSGLSSLTNLDLLQNDRILPLIVSLEKVGAAGVRAVAPAGAPFALTLPVVVANGALAGGATTLAIAAGEVATEAVTVVPGNTEAVTVDLGTPLPQLPSGHQGYAITRAATGLPVTTQAGTTCTLDPGDLWCGVVTVDPVAITGLTNGHGYSDAVSAGDLTVPRGFTAGPDTYTINTVATGAFDGEQGLLFSLDSGLTAAVRSSLELHVGGDQFAFSASADVPQAGVYFWPTSQDWSSEPSVTLTLRGLASMDAALSDLAVSDGGSDLLTFASGTTTYTAMVANDVATVTFTATKNDVGASVAYLDADGNVLADADTTEDGFQVVLAGGAHVVRVRVTAEDGTTTETYKVTVTRPSSIVTDGVSVTSTPLAATDTYGAGETIEISVTFKEAVNATTATDFVLSVGVAKRAPLLRGRGTDTLVFGYTVQAGDRDANGIWIGDQDRTLVGDRDGDPQNGAITSVAGVAAVLTHGEVGTQSGHKVNGSLTPPAANTAPVITTTSPVETPENGTAVATLAATDADDDPITWTKTGGADTARFALTSAGVLTFVAAPDYEDPADVASADPANAAANNEYVVFVTASDENADTDDTELELVVRVTNVDEGQSGTVSIDDTAPMVGDELTASTTGVADPDGLPDPFEPTWRWYRTPAGGAEAEISGATSATYTVVEADLDAALTAKASWTDAGGFTNTLASAPTAAVTALPTVTVAAAAGGETVPEGTDAAFTLSRTGATTAALTVAVAVSETGSVLKDASAVPSSVTFAADAATATLALETNDDDMDNDDGTVTVTLVAGDGYQVGTPGAATVAVSDNDVPVDFVLAVPATVAEDAGPATVTVTATTAENAGPATALAVQLARVGGTATGGTDYDAVSVTARFQVSDFAPATVDGQPRYQAVWTHAVVIHDDEVVEGDETVVLEMSPTSAFLLIHTLHGGSDAVRATLTIVDNDVLPTVTVAAATGGEPVTEGTDAAFTLSRTGATTAALTVTVTVSQTGSVLKDASAVPSSVTFAAGADEATLALATNDDDTDDDDGTVTVTLGAATGYTVGDPGAATVAVSDNDVPVDFVLAVPATVAEDAGPATVTVTATTAENAGPATALAVQLARVGGTATGGTDYNAVSVTARFQVSDFAPATVDGQPRYQAVWTYDVVIHDDEVVEGDETVVLEMSPTSAFLLIHTLHGGSDPVRATLTITDDDTAATVTIAADHASFTAVLDDVTFTLTRTGDLAAELAVSVALTQDKDLIGSENLAHTVTFEAGEATATLNIYSNLFQGSTVTGETTLTATVQDGSDYVVGSPNTASTRIRVADPAVTASFEQAAYTFDEAAGDATVAVILRTATGVPIPHADILFYINYVLITGGASDKGDFEFSADAIKFVPSDFTADGANFTARKEVTLAIVDDELNEPDEALTVILERLPSTQAVVVLSEPDGTACPTTERCDATVTITDNDPLPTLSVANAEAAEGDDVTFKVTLSEAATDAVTVNWATSVETGDTATSGTDFTAANDMLTFMPGETTATFAVQTTEDTTDEDNETFTVTLSSPTNATLATDPTATGTITDAALPVVTIERDDSLITEDAGAAGFTLTRTGSTTAALPVTVAVTQEVDRDLLPDGAEAERTVTFAVGSATATLSVELENDDLKEAAGDLTVEVRAGTGYTVGDPASATVRVSDTDTGRPTPANLRASVGAGVGEVVLSWDAHAPYLGFARHQYRYKTDGDYPAEWTDIPNSGQDHAQAGDGSNLTGYTVTGLVGGQLHTFGVRTYGSSSSASDPSDEATATPRSAVVSFGAESYSVDEGGTVAVTVQLDAAPGREVVVPVSAAGVGGATPPGETGADWSGVPENVTFGATDTAQTFTLAATDDTDVETGESVTLSFGTLPDWATAGTPSEATVTITDAEVPVVTIAADNSVVFEEQGNAGFTLSRTGSTAAVLTVTVAVTQEKDRVLLPDGAAAARTVTFAVNSATTALSVALDDDDLSETRGKLTVEVQAGTGYTVGDPGSATVSVVDADTGRPQPANLRASVGAGVGEVVLSWDAHALHLEFSRHQYRHKTDGDYPAEWTDIPNSGQNNSLGGDGSNLTGYTVTGLVGGQLHTFEVRTFFPKSNDPGDASDPSDEATATPRSAVVSFGAESYSVDEGGTVAVTVQLDAAPGREVVVPVSAAGVGGATPPGETGADWSGVPENVTFGATDTAQTFTLAATDDTDVETGESVALTFGTLPAGVTAGTPSEATVTIVDADVSLPTLSVANAAAAESDGVAFTVTLSAAATDDVTVTWTASIESGDSAETADFGSPLTERVTFTPSQTAVTITVPTIDDSTDEDNDTFTLTLSSPSANATLASDATATGTITDNDDPPTISVEDQTVIEGDQDPDDVLGEGSSTLFPFRATLSAASEKRVRYRTRRVELASDTATDADLYTHPSILGGVQSFRPGNTFHVDDVYIINDDDLDEPDETFTLEIYDFENATAGTQTSSTITIEDDDDPPSVSVGDEAAAEGAPMEFTVTLSAASGREVTVGWATSVETGDSATADTDFTAASGTLTFMPDETTAMITVQTADDTTDEDDETFTVTLSNATNATLATDPTATGTITDVPALPALSVANAAAATDDVTVTWTASIESGDSAETADFGSPLTERVTFTPSQTAVTITVPTIDDSTDEDNDTFTLTLSSPSATATLASDATATGTITDNDDPPTISVEDRTVIEGDQDPDDVLGQGSSIIFPFRVTLSAASEKRVRYKVRRVELASDTATDADLQPSVSFRGIQSITGVTFRYLEGDIIRNDDLDEPDETFTLEIYDFENATAGAKVRSTITIQDDDDPPSVSVGDATAAEGAPVEFPVTLSAASGREVAVNWATTDDSATADTDFTAASGTLTITPGETTATVAVATIEDTLDEPDETFTLTLSSPSNATLGEATATGTITDNDDPPTLGVADAAATEGAPVEFPVTLSAAATDDVTATWTASTIEGDEEKAVAADLESTTGSVTVPKGETTATFTVATAEDALDENDETFTVALSSPSSNATLAADATTATGTITDDDARPALIIADMSAPEESNVEFTVTLTPASGRTVTVGWGTFLYSGQTAEEEDFTSFPQNGFVTFPPGQTTARLQVGVVDDALVESDETFEVTLGSASNARLEDNSAIGTIVDNDVAPNAAPTFTSSATFDAAENQTAVGTVRVEDSDGDAVTGYAIQGGTDALKFAIDKTNGALTFQAAPNYEAPQDANTDNAYVVVVRATSGTDARVMTADQTITVTVMDDDTEAPAAPAAPSVSPASATSLSVTWSAPDNAGPEITDYDVQYRAGTSAPWSDGSHIGTALTAMITGLLEDTEYDVQVRATNAEGTGGWSASGRGETDANAAPSFTSSATFNPAENQTAVGTVEASDSDEGDEVTGYVLSGGADQALFSINNSGVLTFQAAPNYEDPQDANTDNAYVVVVQATSGTGDREQTGTQTITVTVMDVNTEAPDAPGAPSVSPASATSLTVTWSAPDNAGPAITDYDYRHRTTSPQGAWVEVTNTTSTARSATIGSLQEDTSYDVQVRATNAEGTGGWSDSGSGRTDANAAPSFTSSDTFNPAENQTAVGTVEAEDSDTTDDITGYALSGGADQALFSINNSGVLTFQAAPDYEDPQDANTDNAYLVTVQATSGTGDRVKTAPQAITVTVMDANEQPDQPAKPTLAAVSGSATSLVASWTKPGRNGGPDITGYNVQYRVSTATTWDDFTHTGTATTTTITGLTASTSYQVRVQALNGETPSAWSDPSEAVSTEADAANNPPVFSGSMTTRTVPENSAADTNVGAPVTAMDDDRGDTLTYSLDGTNAASFDIDEDSGQIRTRSGVTYNHEEKSSYAVIVAVTDDTDRATIGVLIDIADVDEQPDQPAKPTLAAVSGSATSLVASWTKPGRNGGPDITGYNVNYRVSTVTAWETFTHRGAGVTRTITGLTASTSYQVRVQALNGETPSAWSDPSEAVRTEADAPTPEDADTPTPEEDADRLLQVTCAIARKNGVTDSEGLQCGEYLDGDGARTLEQLIALQTQIIDRLPPGQYDYYDLAGRQTLYKAEDGRSTTTKGGSSEPGSSEPDAPLPVSPLTAHFADLPSGHDGGRAFTLRIAFSEAIAIGYEAFRDHSVGVSGGAVTKARRVDKRRDLWEITVKPASDAAVSVSLSPPPACDETGAICTGDGRPLSASITAIVPGPAQEAEEPEEDQPEEDQPPEEEEQPEEEQPEEEEQPQEPPAPQNLTGVANSDGSITLSWDAPDDDTITGYQILRRRSYFGEDELLTYVADTGSTATSYTDTEATPKVRHVYRVKAINPAGVGHRSNSISVTAAAAKVVATSSGLAPSFPNPFNSRTLIPYRLATPGAVRLEIYNLLGQPLRTLVDQYQDAGFYKVRWDARDRRGALVSAGMYLVRLHYPGGVQTQRLLYLK